jgi:GNAT superfamily N-acetyltransferase
VAASGSGRNQELVIRDARPGDGSGCAAAWADAGRHVEELDPDVGQVPGAAGLDDWFEQSLARPRPPGKIWLVAELGGQVTGFVEGVVEPPGPDAAWQIQRDLSRYRLMVGVLAVSAAFRKMGIGTALMLAIEDAARSQGAQVSLLDTSVRSDLSVPFYEHQMAYSRRAVIFRNTLPGSRSAPGSDAIMLQAPRSEAPASAAGTGQLGVVDKGEDG